MKVFGDREFAATHLEMSAPRGPADSQPPHARAGRRKLRRAAVFNLASKVVPLAEFGTPSVQFPGVFQSPVVVFQMVCPKLAPGAARIKRRADNIAGQRSTEEALPSAVQPRSILPLIMSHVAFLSNTTKKPTWRNTQRYSTTSAYSLTGPPPRRITLYLVVR